MQFVTALGTEHYTTEPNPCKYGNVERNWLRTALPDISPVASPRRCHK
ncbi:hypothetical protein MIDIC_200001 [Alphaproteobacteria bacterium]